MEFDTDEHDVVHATGEGRGDKFFVLYAFITLFMSIYYSTGC